MVTVHLNGHAVEHTFTADELYDARLHWSQFGEVTYTKHPTIIASGHVPLRVRLVHGPGERHPGAHTSISEVSEQQSSSDAGLCDAAPKKTKVLADSQIKKLEAHSSHLLDAFIGLRQRYAMLEPMLFAADVLKGLGSRRQDRGYEILKHSLFVSCAQDIAKLSSDDDKRTPSICNLVAALESQDIRSFFRERFAIWRLPSVEEESDPDIKAAMIKMEGREEADRRAQFDRLYDELAAEWVALFTAHELTAFRTIRDRISAHTEVRFVADKYQFQDIAALGIKWRDLGDTIERMQRLVRVIGLLVRNAGFAWDMLDEQLSKAASEFWLPERCSQNP